MFDAASLSDQPSSDDWQKALESVMTDFDCVTGTLHRLNPEDQQLKLVAHKGIPPQLMPIIASIPVGKGIAGAAAERREPIELCNLQTDTSGVAKPGALQTQVQGSLAVPVMEGSELRGTLGIGKHVPYEFTADEKARLMAVGASVAAKLAAG